MHDLKQYKKKKKFWKIKSEGLDSKVLENAIKLLTLRVLFNYEQP